MCNKFQFIVPMSSAPQRLPCVKGAGKIGSSEPILTEGLTTPPVKIEDFDHLPLHRGGSRFALHSVRQTSIWRHIYLQGHSSVGVPAFGIAPI